MNVLQAIFLGIIQGLTEFIPVSSSGHLVLSQYYFGIGSSQDISFEVFLHLGSLLAVVIFFRKQIWDLICALFHWKQNIQNEIHRKNRAVIMYLILATFATGIFFLIFKGILKQSYENPLLVSFMLLITGAMIFASDYIKNTSVPISNIGILKSLFIGLIQGVAIIPGISRSGCTITASLFCGIKRKDAANFSFLLSIPAILAANVSELPALKALDPSVLNIYIAGFVASFIAAYLVIAILIRLIQAGSLKYFSFYLWLIGIASIAYILLH